MNAESKLMGFCFLLLPQPSRSLRPAFVPDHPAVAHSYPPQWGVGAGRTESTLPGLWSFQDAPLLPWPGFRAVLSPGGALLAFRNWEMQPGNAV